MTEARPPESPTDRAVAATDPAAKPSREPALNIGRGALMGMADIVPGVSGGTVALILGIYPRLVNAIRRVDTSLLRAFLASLGTGTQGRRQLRRKWQEMDAPFLLLLALGIGIGVLAASRPMHWLMEHQPLVTLAFFFGLVLASTIVPWRMIQKRGATAIGLILAGAVVAYVVTGLPVFGAPPGLWFVPVAGAVAIMAMILPGVSGAYLLVVMGMYERMLSALNTFDLPRIFLFMGGAFFGLLAFSHLLSYLLRVHRDATLAVLLGLMLGSLRRVWPFKEGGTDEFASGHNVLPDVWALQTLLAVLAFLVGILLILLLDFSVQRRVRRQATIAPPA